MKKTMIATSALVLLSILLSACNLQGASPTQMGPDQINTIAAATVQALTTQMAPPPATATPLPTEIPTATATLAVPTLNLTGVPTLSLSTSTLIPLPTTSGSAGCNQIGAVEDITIIDNDPVRSGQWFEKRWKLTNAGTCTWTTAYNANFASGDTLQGDVSAYLRSNVPPGASIEVAIMLKAPKEDGTYKQYWNLTDADGKPFGIGPSGANYWVVFKVGESAAPSTTLSSSISWDGSNLTGTITTTSSSSVTYAWQVSASQTSGYTEVNGTRKTVSINGAYPVLPTNSSSACNLIIANAGDNYFRLNLNEYGYSAVGTFTCP